MKLNKYLGKSVFVILTNGRHYEGVLEDIDFIYKGENDSDVYLITIFDKFGKYVSFSSKEISLIDEEEKRDERRNRNFP